MTNCLCWDDLKVEMAGMAGRIARVRGELRKSLESKMPAKDWSFVTSQIGMFSFTGLSPVQVGRGGGIRGRSLTVGILSTG